MSVRSTLSVSLALGLALAADARADEGMWMPTQLPQIGAALARAGFAGDPATLADVTRPLMSAVPVASGVGTPPGLPCSSPAL